MDWPHWARRTGPAALGVRAMTRVFQALVAFSSCWILGSSLWFYPHSLSYFNELVGGPANGPRHLLGSNVDWGQDLRYLAERCKRQIGRANYAACYSYAPLSALGIDTDGVIPANLNELSNGTVTVFYVSANLACGMPWVPAGNICVTPEEFSSRLAELCKQPRSKSVGYSIITIQSGKTPAKDNGEFYVFN